MRGLYFHIQVNQKVFFSTNAKFLEEGYMMNDRVKHDIDWRTLEDTPTLAQRTMRQQVPTPTILVNSSTFMAHCSGRIVIQPDKFMYLREFIKAIPKEHETDPIDYNNAMSSNDVILWQRAMEVKLESMYSNGIWDLVEVPELLKLIGGLKKEEK